MDDPGRWKLLGERLKRRRTEIDPAHHSRAEFMRSGAVGVSASVIRDIEQGNRTNYDAATIAAVETGYRLEPGSVAAFIGGNDSALVPVRSVTPSGAVTVLQVLSGSPGAHGMDIDEVEDAIDLIEDLRARTEFRRMWRAVWRPAVERARQERQERTAARETPGMADGAGA
jgi:transcriptional regulator with XRE-family HTH domain